MRLWVAVTDNDWFGYLSTRPDLDEVNFWQPSGQRQFRVLSSGEPFLFKLHSPRNSIVGGGFFATSSLLPASLVWEAFGEKNGARTFVQMRRQIERYRRKAASLHEDYTIGCIILQAPFFFDEADWIPMPSDFSPNIPGKAYDLTSAAGQKLWAAVKARLGTKQAAQLAEAPPPMYGEPVLVSPRLGQGAFRVLITDIYDRRCAVTGERALPVLEAAHIRPVSEGGHHRIDNGLLLRSDLHRLLDRGYVTITPDYRFQVSRKLKEDFDNGEPYYPLAGREIWVPSGRATRPHRDFLEWHAETIFRG